MIIKTTVCDLTDGKFNNLSDLAHTMGISVSQVYRVKTGKRNINQKFITGAVKAFPQYRLDQPFYLALEAHLGNNEQPSVTTRHHRMVAQYNNSPSPAKSSYTTCSIMIVRIGSRNDRMGKLRQYGGDKLSASLCIYE